MAFPTFNSGDVLTASDMNAVGLWLVKTQAVGATAVNSVSVTDAFSSTYDCYKIIVSGGVGSTNLDLRLQLGSSTTGYYSGIIYHPYGTAGPSNAQATGSGLATSWLNVGNASTSMIAMNCDLQGPNFTKPTAMQANLSILSTAGSVAFSSGFHDVSTAYTGFTILTSTGTITGGTIRVYGYRN